MITKIAYSAFGGDTSKAWGGDTSKACGGDTSKDCGGDTVTLQILVDEKNIIILLNYNIYVTSIYLPPLKKNLN